MAGFFARVTGRGSTTGKNVVAELKRVTHSSSLGLAMEIPGDVLASVTEASNSEEQRREIMQHLRECLAEPSGKHWRRVYGALGLLQSLVKVGSSEVMVETAEGRHFDLVQRLSFLEHYDNTDKKVQGMVRTRAETLRKAVILALESAGMKEEKVEADAALDTASTCSPSSVQSKCSVGIGSEASGSTSKTDAPTALTRMILNNVVTVGHSDDTTSESEGGEDGAHAPVRFCEARRMSARARNERSSQGKGYPSEATQEPATAITISQMPAQPVDLLDF